MRLDHAGISVDDLAGAERFLGETLGLRLVRHSAPSQRNQVAFYSVGNADIEVVWFPDAAERARRFGAAGHGVDFSHVALGVDDLGPALAALRARDVDFAGDGPTTSRSRTMQMSDPATTAGITVQLIQWYPPVPDADMPPVDPPAAAEDIGITGLDHVAAFVDDLDAAKRRLIELFGLTLTDDDAVPERGLRFAYLALPNAQIEVIAFDDPDRRAASLAPGRRARLDHIGLAVRDMPTTAATLRQRGVAFATAEPGRFRNLTTWNTDPATTMGVRFQLIQRG